MIQNLTWQKPYHGPFTKREALELAADLKKAANPEINGIHDVKIQKRVGGYVVLILSDIHA